MQEARVLCVGGCIDNHDWLSATVYVPEWMESWLQEFGAAFVYALDKHSHGGSLSMLVSCIHWWNPGCRNLLLHVCMQWMGTTIEEV